jgi:hypothetical protein
MSLVLRGDLGRKLSIEEMDGNFTYLDNKTAAGGGYQVLGSSVIDLTLATQSLTYPIVLVATRDSDPQFAEGDFVEAGDGIVTGSASVHSVVINSSDPLRSSSIYRIELDNVQGVIYNSAGHPLLSCQASGASGDMTTYYDWMGPDQEITLVGDYNVIKSVLLFNASGDISSSGKLAVYTGEKRSGNELLNTADGRDILESFTDSTIFNEITFTGVSKTDAQLRLISNTLYVTVNTPINSGELTLIVYGYSLDSFI